MTVIDNMTGKMYSDEYPKGKGWTLESKVSDLIKRYIADTKSETNPNIVLVSANQFSEEQRIAGIRLVPVRSVRDGFFWIGVGNVSS